MPLDRGKERVVGKSCETKTKSLNDNERVKSRPESFLKGIVQPKVGKFWDYYIDFMAYQILRTIIRSDVWA